MDNLHNFDSTNIASWYHFFDKKIAFKDLEKVVYKFSKPEIDTMLLSVRDKQNPASVKLKGNSVLTYPNSSLILDFLTYLNFAKLCEPYSATLFENWRIKCEAWAIERTRIEPVTKKNYLKFLFESGEKLSRKTRSSFIWERYMFQIGRLYFQSGDMKSCCRYFERVKGKFKTRQNIKYRLMSYAAGAYLRRHNYARSNYLYAMVFDKCPELRKESVIGFHPQEEADFNATLRMAKDNHEKSVIWFLLGYNDPQRGLRKIYELEPKSQLLSVLLTRYMNIAEENFSMAEGREWRDRSLSPIKDINKLYEYSTTTIPDSDLTFIKNIADSNNTYQPYLWDIAAGYLSTVMHHYTDAHEYLNSAFRKAADDVLVRKQVRLLRFYLAIEEAEKVTPALQSYLYKEFKWLARNDDVLGGEFYSVQEWACGRLAAKHYSSGQYVLAECLYKGIDPSFYSSEAKINRLLKMMLNKNKSEYERFALGYRQWGPDAVYNYLGYMALQKEKPETAFEKFRMAETAAGVDTGAFYRYNHRTDYSYSGTLVSDPFLTSIREREPKEWESMKGKTPFTKLGVAKKLAELFTKAKQDPKNSATEYFAIATVYYNMTYFGNARELYQTAVRPLGIIDFYYGGFDKKLTILDCSLAKKYYQKALHAATNVELKARCCFMLARCEQNDFYVRKPANYKGDFRAGKYFRVLKSDYAHTKYYQEILAECGYFRKFSSK
ncbi:MAG: hypothetical protein HYV28_12755 [Ignavibacteriales bacterium]|nr:hypothetical protein [Ignavibacteriales bacterium]